MNKKYKTKRQVEKAHIKAVAKYQKKATTSFAIRLHNVNDCDVIRQLNSVPNKTDYIRRLILEDLNKK